VNTNPLYELYNFMDFTNCVLRTLIWMRMYLTNWQCVARSIHSFCSVL